MMVTKEILRDIEQERINQMSKYDEMQPLNELFIVLSEEVGEVAQALQAGRKWSKMSDKQDLYLELVQVAAVAVKMAEQVRNNG